MRRWILYLSPLWASALAAVVLLSEHGLRVPPPLRKTPPAARADALAQATSSSWSDVEVASDGLRLRAWYFQPSRWRGDAVILLHGVADTRLGVTAHAGLLLKHGYAVLLPDSRAHGASEGEMMTFGVRESGDVRQWTEWLRERTGARHVYGLGESMGAAILLQAAAAGAPIKSVVAESPFASFPQIARYRVAQAAGLAASPLRHAACLIVDPALLVARLRYGVDLYAASPERAVRDLRVPVLLIHGSNDTNIPPSHSEAIRAANPQVQLWRIPGGNHVDAIGVLPAEFERRVVDWFHSQPTL